MEQEAPTDAQEWFDKLWAYYKAVKPTARQDSVPASSKADCRKKFFSIVKKGKVTPEQLAFAVEAYVNDRVTNSNFVQALSTVIGTARPCWEEYLEK